MDARPGGFDRSYVTLTLLWIALILLIDPRGAFPIGDDWSYTRMLANFVGLRRILPTDATSVPLIGQILWAAPFTWLVSSTLAASRLSTIVLGLVGALGLYTLLRGAGVSRRPAWFAAAALLTNPLWIWLSCSFMTDVPFAAIGVVGLLAVTRANRTDRPADLAVGILLIVWATLIRQVGLALAVGVGAAMLARGPRDPRTVARALAPGVAAAIALWGYSVLLDRTVGLPTLYYRREVEVAGLLSAWAPLAKRLAMGAIAVFLYTGLALIPTIPFLWIADEDRARRSRTWAFAAAAVIVLFAALARLRKMLPVTGNILNESGLGAPTIAGAESLPALPVSVRVLVTLAAVAAMVLAMVRVVGEGRRHPDRFLLTASLVTAIVYTGVVAQIWVYDRYTTFLVPLALAAAMPVAERDRPWSGARLAVAGALIAAQAGIGVGATRDYFAWNRARWEALADLSNRGIAPVDVDGGLEFNGWSAYDANRPLGVSDGWWRRPQAEFRVAFSAAPGWSVVAQYRYRTTLPLREGRLLLLKRNVGAR